MDAEGPISGTTYFNRFGSWHNALDAAGLTTRTDDDRVHVEGFCTVCCDPVTTPVSELAADGRPYCTTDCEDVFATGRIDFTDDVLSRDGCDEEVVGRFAALLYNLETYVPDVLLYLHHSLTMARAEFLSAAGDRCRISRLDGAVEVVSEAEGLRFRADDVLATIENRIENVTGPTDSVYGTIGGGDAVDVRPGP